jgi:hypothetical protein
MRRGQAKGQRPDPIARWEPGADGDEVLFMDTLAMTIHLGVDARTVRRYEAVACDVATRAPLWDAFAVGEARRTVRARARPASRSGVRLAA